MNILVGNIKKRMETETGRIKAEYQQKLSEEVDAIVVENLIGTVFELSEAQLDCQQDHASKSQKVP